jgi:hypothetical protein
VISLKKKIILRLDEEPVKVVTREAKRRGISRNKLIEELIKNKFKINGKQIKYLGRTEKTNLINKVAKLVKNYGKFYPDAEMISFFTGLPYLQIIRLKSDISFPLPRNKRAYGNAMFANPVTKKKVQQLREKPDKNPNHYFKWLKYRYERFSKQLLAVIKHYNPAYLNDLRLIIGLWEQQLTFLIKNKISEDEEKTYEILAKLSGR